MTLEELKAGALKKDKGNTITESDYTFRKKSPADIGVNTIIMVDTSKYADAIAQAKAEILEETKASKGAK